MILKTARNYLFVFNRKRAPSGAVLRATWGLKRRKRAVCPRLYTVKRYSTDIFRKGFSVSLFFIKSNTDER